MAQVKDLIVNGDAYLGSGATVLGNLQADTFNDRSILTANAAVSPSSSGTGIVTESYLAWALTGLLKPIVFKPTATLLQTYSYDKNIVSGEGKTWPGYTTSSTVLLASAAQATTITVDLANYTYLVVERMLSIPTYSVSTVAKGRCEYNISVATYELTTAYSGELHALINTSLATTANTNSVVSTGTFSREIYYSSGTALAAYSTATYGCYQTVTAPTLSSSTLTINSPALGTRGHTTYFTSTYMNAVSDVRYQWVIEVWRCPKTNDSLNGWATRNNFTQVVSCVDSATHKLS